MKERRIFFLWFIPILWAGCSLLSFQFPGDEYGLWALSSIAGVWIGKVFPFGDIHNSVIPLSVALVGAAAITPFGLLMDLLRVGRVLWAVLYVLCGAAVLIGSIHSFESIDAALTKNGSWAAYIFFSANSGMYFAVFLSILFTLISLPLRKKGGFS